MQSTISLFDITGVRANLAEGRGIASLIGVMLRGNHRTTLFAGEMLNLLLLIVLAVIPGDLSAQQTGPAAVDMSELTIDKVRFVGNVRFATDELADAVSSRPTERSLARRAFEFYYDGLNANKSAPGPALRILKSAITSIPDGRRYFSPETAQGDVGIIEELYNQHGYHDAKATYDFVRDSITKEYTLTFTVSEGKPYTIRAVEYRGLDNLPPEVAGLVAEQMTVKAGGVFDEAPLNSNANAIDDILKNNGWYFSSYSASKPTVYTDTSSKSDSILIIFVPGKRIKIGSVSIERQLNGQSAITDDLVYELSQLHEGDWYSRKKVVATVNALYQLGVYDFVTIDTVGRQAAPDSAAGKYNLRIYTRYKEQQEIGVSPFLNRTANDNLTNFGVEGLYSHRNVFGASQNFNFFIRYIWNDFQLSLADGFSSTSSEIQTGISIIQPVLWSFNSFLVSSSGQAQFSSKFVLPQVSVNSISFKGSLPTAITDYFLTSFVPELSLDLQSVGKGSLIPTTDTSGNVQRGIIEPLRMLNAFTGETIKLTSVVLGLNFAGDTRNDFFTPVRGHLFTFNFDWAPKPLGLLARYLKLQTSYLGFEALSQRTVFAFKLRLGHIFADSGDYIPVERLFFAGGANSIRSYGARQLFDPFATKYLPDSLKQTENIGILTGSKSLIEGSFEARWNFLRPGTATSFLTSQLERMGLTFFLDYGSTYNSSSKSPTLADIIENMAVGFGFGFRYATPVGPFRIDLATKLYDPTSPDRPFITRRSPFQDLQLHIGLGHAF